jgi:Arc/MetJ-type ribon-helix-helix transcriptional regulator
MPIQLPEELESSIRSLVQCGLFAAKDDAVAEAVRSFLRQRKGVPVTSDLGSIGAMRDAADELDEIVEDAMRQRRQQPWRVIPGE